MTDFLQPGGQEWRRNPVPSGLLLAAQRLDRYGLELDVEAVLPVVALAVEVVRSSVPDERANPAAVEMFVENVAVGATLRRHNGFEQLSRSQLAEGLAGTGPLASNSDTAPSVEARA